MMIFTSQRDAALALLNSGVTLNRRSGSFLGQLCADDTPMTIKQSDWLDALLEKAGLGPLEIEGIE